MINESWDSMSLESLETLINKGFASDIRYLLFWIGALLLFENKIVTCGGTQNKGKSIVLKEMKRSINPKKLKLLSYNAGIACVS